MQQDIVRAMHDNPKYHELVSKRRVFSWTLAIVMLTIYYGFVFLVAYGKAFLGTPISPGATMTIGIPIGLGVIVSAFVLTGIYVARANSQFDRLNRELKEGLE